MMENFAFDNMKISLNCEGAKKYLKVSYPVKYGMFSIIETDRYIYYFNLNGEIRYIQLKGRNYPGDEWLKRSISGNWIYFTPGIYTGIFSFLGEYYLPCFPYESNSIFAYRPFENKEVPGAINSIHELIASLSILTPRPFHEKLISFIDAVIKNNPSALKEKAGQFRRIINGNVSVLPPDTRHVDYDVIPVIISDGCIYNCDFCMVKSGEEFKARGEDEIERQMEMLKNLYDKDIINYNSIFLGMHDALHSGVDLISHTLQKARNIFNIRNSCMAGSNLFIFGSVESVLCSRDVLWQELNKSGFYTYINVGFESFDPETLRMIHKPIAPVDIQDAFRKILHINRIYENIEVSINFLMGDDLPERHYESIIALSKNNPEKIPGKTTLYLSPLPGSTGITALQNKFKEIKTSINMPVYLYIIQSL